MECPLNGHIIFAEWQHYIPESIVYVNCLIHLFFNQNKIRNIKNELDINHTLDFSKYKTKVYSKTLKINKSEFNDDFIYIFVVNVRIE